jgi:threonine efflux protein
VKNSFSGNKTAMFITSLFAAVLPKEPELLFGIMIVTLMVVISFIWYTFVLLLFSSKKFRNNYSKIQKWIGGFAGIIFLAFDAKLIFGNE